MINNSDIGTVQNVEILKQRFIVRVREGGKNRTHNLGKFQELGYKIVTDGLVFTSLI